MISNNLPEQQVARVGYAIGLRKNKHIFKPKYWTSNINIFIAVCLVTLLVCYRFRTICVPGLWEILEGA